MGQSRAKTGDMAAWGCTEPSSTGKGGMHNPVAATSKSWARKNHHASSAILPQTPHLVIFLLRLLLSCGHWFVALGRLLVFRELQKSNPNHGHQDHKEDEGR